jgi:NitT/TauT family transport system substrate-binding protein
MVDIVETKRFGQIAWYSRDVMPRPKGHVELIAISKDSSIKEKSEALREVIYYIHKADLDFEKALKVGGDNLREIS